MDTYAPRIESARKLLAAKRLDALILFSGDTSVGLSSKNTYYFSGFFDSWPHAVVLTKKDAVFFTSDATRAEKKTSMCVKDLKKTKISEYLKSVRARTVGVDSEFTFRNLNALKAKMKTAVFKDVTRELLALRSVKDAEEIKKISAACKDTRNILQDAGKRAMCGSELHLMKLIKSGIARLGADPAFFPILAGDKNSANMHYFDCNGRYNEILMADIGVTKEFYNSDFTRTYVLRKNKEMLRAHETLEALISELSDFITPGVTCLETFSFAKSFLEKKGYKKESFANFHSLGHGVGLDVHEFPVLSRKAHLRNAKLEENMVFTLEPALYFKNRFGVRIENTCILTKNGLQAL